MTRPPALLVLDAGLTNCKASLYDLRAQRLAHASERYPTRSPAPGHFEQECDDWIAAFQAGLTQLAEPLARVEVAAIIVTAHMHGLVGLDRDGTPVAPCWTLFDQRALLEAEAIRGAIPNSYAITGARLEPYTPAAKILWMKKQQPALFGRVHTFVAPKDALRVLLGGAPCTDPIDAAGMLLAELESGQWSPALVEAVGSPPLGEIRAPWTGAGTLSSSAAARLGLREGIPLLTGAGDDIETLGAGLVDPGQTLEHLGTTGTLVTCTAEPLRDPQQRLEAYPHAVPGRFLVGGATNAAGLSLDWAARLLGASDAHGRLVLEPGGLQGSPPIYLPWIRGERGLLWDPHATGAWLGLRESHSTSDLARAVYEGVAFSVYEILDAILALGEQNGLEVAAVVSGSPLGDGAWDSLRSSLYRRPLLYPVAQDLTGLGCALVGLVGLGVYADLIEAVQTCSAIGARIDPQPALAAELAPRYRRYKQVAAAYGTVCAVLAAEQSEVAFQRA